MIKRVCRCHCRPRSREFGQTLGGQDCVNSEMYLEPIIEHVGRYTLRLWSIKIGGVLGDDWSGGDWSENQQHVEWFGSHNWTMQQLWTATLILPDAPSCSQIGWMQSDVLSGAPRQPHCCSSMLRKLWNRIQEYHAGCIVVFKMLPNQTITMCTFPTYWEYWPHLQEYSGAPQSWSHTLREWLM